MSQPFSTFRHNEFDSVGKTRVFKVSSANLKILECVHQFITEHGFAPTLREICKRTGLKSISTVNTHLCTLTFHNLIHRRSDSPRAMAVTQQGLDKLKELKK